MKTKLHILTLLLGMGALQAQAGVANVTVIQNNEQSITVAKGDELMILHTPKKKRWLSRGLAKGDEVSVTFEQDGEKLYVTHLSGEGTVKGTVKATTEKNITVETAEGVRHTLIPPWRGGMPKDGGGLQKDVLEQIRRVEVGQTVILKWKIEEGKRVIGVKPVS